MPDYSLRLIIATDDPTHSRLYVGYNTTQTKSIYGQVRDDQQSSLSLEPVVSAPAGSDNLFLADSDPVDTYEVGIGIADQPATSGTFALTVAGSTTGMTALAFDVNAASLQTVISAAMVAGGKPACTVTAVGTLGGAFAINATANGAVPTGVIASDATNLFPNCDVAINEISLGSGGSKYQIILAIRQQPYVLAFPSTPLPATVLSVDVTQVASAVLNAINTLEFTVDPVGGSFAVAAYANGISRAVGVILASKSATEFQAFLETFAPLSSNVSVTKVGSSFVVAFKNQCAPQNIIASSVDVTATEITTEGNHGFASGMFVTHSGTNSTPNTDGSHQITVTDVNKYTIAVAVTVAGTVGVTRDTTDPLLIATDVNLISPQGVSGVINNNTINFWQASQGVDGEYFDAFIAIRRTRASGEKRVIFFSAIQLSKDIFDTDTLVPLTFPSYYTGVQSDARFVKLAGGNIIDDDQELTGNLQVDGSINVGNSVNLGGGVSSGGDINAGGAIESSSPSSGVGYGAGAGGTVTQITSKATNVSLNKVSGEIITTGANLNDATNVTFTVLNSQIFADDNVIVNHKSGGTAGGYQVWAHSVVAGTSFKITIRNVSGGTLGEILKLQFAIERSVNN